MIVMSSYHNPPYRSPVPRSQTSASPPPNGNNNRTQSPKRKRPEELNAPTPALPAPTAALRVETSFSSDGIPDSGANSPRTKVAERLDRLSLTLEDASPSSSQSPRKKRKVHLTARRDVNQTPQQQQRQRPLEIPDSVSDDNSTLLLEVDETPGAYAATPSSPLPTVHASGRQLDGIVDTEMMEDGLKPPPRPKRLLSPPPPSPLSATALPVDPIVTDDDKGPDPSALTWRDEEITGHEITGPDDDGEGINGIGFRPTPAIAYARSQKRRQQVNEWKAREARDARQKRMDRRRGASSDRTAAEKEAAKRVVRFAESLSG